MRNADDEPDRIPRSDTPPATLARVLSALAEASIRVATRIRRGSLGGALHADVGPAHDGVAQKALDVFADETFVDGLRGSGVRGVVSEERDDFVALDADGTLLVAIDPLDGSSNIEANVTIGTVFSVLDAPAGRARDRAFSSAGTRQRAAGFFVYGPHVDFAFTIGRGVAIATLDPDAGVYRITTQPRRNPPGLQRVRDQRVELPPLAGAGPGLCRGSASKGEEGPRGTQFQHALGRLDGRRRLSHPDRAAASISIPTMLREGYEQRPGCACSTRPTPSPS